jgi:hypothetical protein
MGTRTTVNSSERGTTTAAPPSWTMPGISDAASRVTAALSNLPGERYTGDFTAAPDRGLIDRAVGSYTQAAGNGLRLQDQAMQLLQRQGQPVNFQTQLPQDNGSALQPAINSAIHPVFQQLMEQVLPSIRSSALDSGAYSGDRAMSVLPTQAIENTTNAATRLAGELGFTDYTNRQQRALDAYGLDTARTLGTVQADTARAGQFSELADTAMRMGTGSGDIFASASALDAQQRQAVINNNLQRNEYNWQYPFQGLDTASNLLARLSGSYGTTTSERSGTQTTSTGGAGPILQGVLGAAALGASAFAPGVGGGPSMVSSLFGSKKS